MAVTDSGDKLNAGAGKLRCISPGLDRLLPIESDPLDCEEQMINCSQSLSILIKHLESASAKIEYLPKSDKIDAKERRVAVELTVNVLDILKDYGIQSSAYASASDNESQSKAITILKAIGDCIGLAKAPVTWRDIIRDARKQAPELQVVVDNPLGKGGMPDY